MGWWKKRSMLSQVLCVISVLLLPLLVLATAYSVKVQLVYRSQVMNSIQHTLELHIKTLSDRMQVAATYLNNSRRNDYRIRLLNLKASDDYVVAAALYWQELNREVSSSSAGADGYFFYLPEQDFVNVAVSYSFQDSRSALQNYITEQKEKLWDLAGWRIIEADGKQWLMLVSREDRIYQGAFLEMDGIRQDILSDIQMEHVDVSFGEWLQTEKTGYENRKTPIGKNGLYAEIWVEKKEIRSAIPSAIKFFAWAATIYLIIMPFLIFVLSKILIRPVQTVKEAMRKLEDGDVDYRIAVSGENKDATELNQRFNRMADSLVNLKIQVFEKELERMEVEATNLRLQVNPHFILNSLNIIFSLAKSRGQNNLETIKAFTKYLANYLRYALWHTEGKVRLREELACVANYMEIQKVRFPDRFTYLCDVAEEWEEGLIPSLLILNFVENAIKYALDMERKIDIFVVAVQEEGKLRITVCDTGNGMDQETLRILKDGGILENETGKHIGIWNCRRRMALMYDGEAKLHITSRLGEGTQVFIEIPWEEAQG